jgi:acetyl esterase/lipase
MRRDGSDVRQLTDDAFEEATPAFAPEVTTRGAITHVYKSTESGDLRLHVFPPAGGRSNPRPAVLFFFGGRWATGGVEQFVPQAKYLAGRGMLAIVVDYRVFDRHATTPFEAMADAKSAIRWVRAHAARLAVDPTRIVASGSSSGGHLAVSAAVFDRFDEPAENRAISSKPDAIVLFNPVVDSSKAATFAQRAPGREHEGSPFLQMKAALPPTLILHGRADPLPIESVERFCAKAKQFGSQCDVVGYDGAEHGFFRREIADGKWYRETLLEVDRFLTALGFLSNPR